MNEQQSTALTALASLTSDEDGSEFGRIDLESKGDVGNEEKELALYIKRLIVEHAALKPAKRKSLRNDLRDLAFDYL